MARIARLPSAPTWAARARPLAALAALVVAGCGGGQTSAGGAERAPTTAPARPAGGDVEGRVAAVRGCLERRRLVGGAGAQVAARGDTVLVEDAVLLSGQDGHRTQAAVRTCLASRAS